MLISSRFSVTDLKFHPSIKDFIEQIFVNFNSYEDVLTHEHNRVLRSLEAMERYVEAKNLPKTRVNFKESVFGKSNTIEKIIDFTSTYAHTVWFKYPKLSSISQNYRPKYVFVFQIFPYILHRSI